MNDVSPREGFLAFSLRCRNERLQKLLWNKVKQNLLADRLIGLPRLVYAPSFERDWKATRQASEKVKLHETLARVSRLLNEGHGSTHLLKRDGGLQYEDYTNVRHNDTPVGHFRVTQGRRVRCVAGGGTLTLLHYGEHDYVNP